MYNVIILYLSPVVVSSILWNGKTKLAFIQCGESHYNSRIRKIHVLELFRETKIL